MIFDDTYLDLANSWLIPDFEDEAASLQKTRGSRTSSAN